MAEPAADGPGRGPRRLVATLNRVAGRRVGRKTAALNWRGRPSASIRDVLGQRAERGRGLVQMSGIAAPNVAVCTPFTAVISIKSRDGRLMAIESVKTCR